MEVIKAYQHQLLSVGVELSPAAHAALLRYKSSHRAPYYEPAHQGLRIGRYVGVLQVGTVQLEILPKLDQGDSHHWRDCLLTMLAATRPFEVDILGQAQLGLATGTLLDWYCELYLQHVEELIAAGLLKKYRQESGNSHALRGRLLLSKQLALNHSQQTYFYTCHSRYDTQHALHAALRDAARILERLGLGPRNSWRLANILQCLPHSAEQLWREEDWQRLWQDSRAQHYKPALALARLLLRHFQPDFHTGQAAALSIMFDMDKLWERFILQTLHWAAPQIGWEVVGQAARDFYYSPLGDTRLRADIKLNYRGQTFVLDTKWKAAERASAEDLRQAYAYLHLYKAAKVALIYPGSRADAKGHFAGDSERECSLFFVEPSARLADWRAAIIDKIKIFVGYE